VETISRELCSCEKTPGRVWMGGESVGAGLFGRGGPVFLKAQGKCLGDGFDFRGAVGWQGQAGGGEKGPGPGAKGGGGKRVFLRGWKKIDNGGDFIFFFGAPGR